MADPLVPDDFWAVISPLLPPEPPKPKGGRPRVPDRLALAGILFVLRTGIQWRDVPAEMGCSGKTCWRQLVAWRTAGVWRALASRAAGATARRGPPRLEQGFARQRIGARQKGGAETGPNPTDRGKAGTKRHLVVDGEGAPLGLTLSGANRHDSRMLAPILDAVPPVRGRRGRPRCRPHKLHADKGYDHRRCRRGCRAPGVVPRIARRGIDSSERLERHRWKVERTLAWFAQFRRLGVRHERRADVHLALTTLAAAVICIRQIMRLWPWHLVR